MSFVWLTNWQKTPMDLGAPPARVDPAWRLAMLILDDAFQGERAAIRESR